MKKKKMRKYIRSIEDVHYDDELFDNTDFLDISFDDDEIMPKEERYVYN